MTKLRIVNCGQLLLTLRIRHLTRHATSGKQEQQARSSSDSSSSSNKSSDVRLLATSAFSCVSICWLTVKGRGHFSGTRASKWKSNKNTEKDTQH
ncbi:hypothetical protein ACLKA7_011158 [Drosophila subpalustris]